MSPLSEDDRLARGLADLRLQVNALQVVAKTGSLPETIAKARKTVWRSAILLAAALIVSATIKVVFNDRLQLLEKRVEQLERGTKHP